MIPFLIAVGGALGSLARYWVSELLTFAWGAAFPWGTLIVNVTGSAVIGLAAGAASSDPRLAAAPLLRYFVIVGVCGGYTTFSAFSLQTLALVQAGEAGRATLNVVASVGGCLLATLGGYALAAEVWAR